jgi:membrane fusion protein, heavy metal efflux system
MWFDRFEVVSPTPDFTQSPARVRLRPKHFKNEGIEHKRESWISIFMRTLHRPPNLRTADWNPSLNWIKARLSLVLLGTVCLLMLNGCAKAKEDEGAGAPPAATVVPVGDPALFTVDHPEQFPLATATGQTAKSEMVVTGTVAADISRAVPVVSMVSGRITAIYARLGDVVHKDQRLLTVRSDDVSGAFSDYRKAVRTEALTLVQLKRSQDLYEHGAISKSVLEVAEQTEDSAKIDVETTAARLHLRGSDLSRPSDLVDIVAPVSGIITDQQVTNAAGVQSLGTNPFTISDLSNVWVICDVYEDDLAHVQLGDTADISLNAYPDRVFKGRVSNIGAILDPSIRTAKVRIELPNPGLMRLGMFVKATFRGQTSQMHTVVPASAVMHMHDRDWVFIPAPDKKFRRLEVVGGDLLPDNMQEIKSGLQPGQQVVANALVLDHVLAQ